MEYGIKTPTSLIWFYVSRYDTLDQHNGISFVIWYKSHDNDCQNLRSGLNHDCLGNTYLAIYV